MAKKIGTGCVKCHPELFPALGASRPRNHLHVRADWFFATHPESTLAIYLDGTRATLVEEAQGGNQGWLIRAHHRAAATSESGYHLCWCGSGENQFELWAGDVHFREVPRARALIRRPTGLMPHTRRTLVG